MARRENYDEVYESLASLNISEVAELFDCSERHVRRLTKEERFLRRGDGQFVICTTCAWWLGFHARKANPQGDPEDDLALLTLRLLNVMGFDKFSLKMIAYLEYFIFIPVPQRVFEQVKREWQKSLPRDDEEIVSRF
jgi:hypothetical protein